jgi:hypothetical protein
MSELFQNIDIVLENGAVNNRAVLDGTVTINSGGVNNAPVTGTVILNSGGSNSGDINGNLFVFSNSVTNTAANIYGNVYLASGVSTQTVLASALHYTGTVTQTVNGALASSEYVAGSTGSPQTINGTYYNLEGDNKARSYTNGVGALFTGAAFNLTGDYKAYDWSSGDKGSLYTGAIDGVAYSNGDAVVANYTAYNVTGDSNSGVLYTAANSNIATGIVYTDYNLASAYTGYFKHSDVWRYSDAGVTSLFTGAAGTAGNYVSVTEGSEGAAASGVLKLANDGLYYTFSSSGTVATLFTGGLDFNGTWYSIFSGIKSATVFSGATLISGVYKRISNGVLTANNASGGEQPRTSDYNFYKFTAGNLVSAFNGAALISNLWRKVTDGVVDFTNYASGVLLSTPGGSYYNFPGNGTRGSLYSGALLISGVYERVYFGSVQSGNANGPLKLDDGVYYNFSDGSIGSTFNGAVYVDGYYRPVTNGVVNQASYASGVLRVADTLGEGKYYILDGNGGGALFTGAYLDGVYYRPVVNGVRSTNAFANGLLMLDSNQLYYTFDNNGGAGTLFNGAWMHPYNGYFAVIDGVRSTTTYANGILILISDGLYYNFPGDGTGSLFTGALNFSGTWYAIADGIKGSVFTGAVNSSGTWYNVVAGVQGGLFNGAYFDGSSYRPITSGVPDSSSYANGVLQLTSDSLYYKFDDTGNAGTLFTGAYYDGSVYRPVTSGVRITGAFANGILQLDSDGLYYTFNETGNAGTLFNGGLDLSGTWYSVVAGVKGDLFTGASFSGSYYSLVSNGTLVYPNVFANGILILASDGLYYNFPGDGTKAQQAFNGGLDFSGTWHTITSGIKGGVFTGASFDGAYYRPVVNGVRGQSSGANGVLMLDSDGLYYTFNGLGGAGSLFTGAYFDGTYYRPVTSGVRDGSTYANGVLQLDSDSLYYKFDNTGNAGTLFTGAYYDGSVYHPVTSGVRDSSSYANGVLQLDSDSLYYKFDNTGNAGALFYGGLDFSGTWYTIFNGTKGDVFTGAYYDGTYYRPVTSGVPNSSTTANGILILASDGLYYNFPGDGTKAQQAFTGASNFSGTWYTITSGIKGGVFTGAYYDSGTSAYRPVATGVPSTSTFANGVLQLASDGLYYTFTNNGGAGALFTGAYYDGTYYRPVTSGVRDGSTYANGVLQLDSDSLYYKFDNTGNAGSLFTGAVSVDNAWYSVVDGVRGSLFTGAYFDGAYYRPVTAGVLYASNSASGILMSANDGEYYSITTAGTLVIPVVHSVTCDTGEALKLAYTGLNTGDQVWLYAVKSGNVWTRTEARLLYGYTNITTFSDGTTKYTLATDGTISGSSACTEYAD